MAGSSRFLCGRGADTKDHLMLRLIAVAVNDGMVLLQGLVRGRCTDGV